MRADFGNINFGRAIKIQTNFDNVKNKNPDYAIENVIASLYGTLSQNSIYDSETSREIGAFLRAQLGDFDLNGRTVFLRKLGNDRYIFTGDEAAKARSLDGKYLHKISKYRAEEKDKLSVLGSKQEMADYRKRCEEYVNEMDRAKERELLKMVEDGTSGKDKTEIIFDFDDENRLKEVSYKSLSSEGAKLRTSQNILTL